MRRLPPTQRNARVQRERDVRALARLALLLFSALVLASGFVFAAQQHFAAVHYGYESESLRSERKRLLEEKQRLLLEKEQASNPVRLESAARKLGLMPLRPGQVGTQKANTLSQLPIAAALVRPSASLNR